MRKQISPRANSRTFVTTKKLWNHKTNKTSFPYQILVFKLNETRVDYEKWICWRRELLQLGNVVWTEAINSRKVKGEMACTRDELSELNREQQVIIGEDKFEIEAVLSMKRFYWWSGSIDETGFLSKKTENVFRTRSGYRRAARH